MDTEGHIVHIDFGFLLSIAPGGTFSLETAPFKVRSPPARRSLPYSSSPISPSSSLPSTPPRAHVQLTEEMVEVLGGLESQVHALPHDVFAPF